MVVCCCVKGCSNDWKPNSDVQFHRFPLKNELLLKEWLTALGRDGFIPKTHTRICSVHFMENDYCQPGSRKLLKPTAIPNVILQSHSNEDHQRQKGIVHTLDICDTLKPLNMTSLYRQSETKREILVNGTFNYDNNKEVACNTNPEICDKHSNVDPKYIIDISTQTFTADVQKQYATSKCLMRRKIKILQQKLKRRDEKIHKMRRIILHMRKEERASEKFKYIVNKHFDGFSAELFRHQYKNNKVKPKQRRYSDIMKKFALKLYFYSPRAYKFVRNNLQLPHCATLRKKQINPTENITDNMESC